MDAHAREAAAAIAGMTETYGTVWKPQAGDRVRCPRAFGGGYQDGTVYGRDKDGWLVDTDEGRLFLYLEELERIWPTGDPVEPGTQGRIVPAT